MAIFPERQRMFVAPQPVWNGSRSEEKSTGDVGNGLAGAPYAAGAPMPQMEKKAESRRGLGTEFGEQRESHVTETEFQRAGSTPSVLLSLRYDDCAGLLAMGIEASRSCCPMQNDRQLRQSAEPFRRNPPFSQPPAGWSGR